MWWGHRAQQASLRSSWCLTSASCLTSRTSGSHFFIFSPTLSLIKSLIFPSSYYPWSQLISSTITNISTQHINPPISSATTCHHRLLPANLFLLQTPRYIFHKQSTCQLPTVLYHHYIPPNIITNHPISIYHLFPSITHPLARPSGNFLQIFPSFLLLSPLIHPLSKSATYL